MKLYAILTASEDGYTTLKTLPEGTTESEAYAEQNNLFKNQSNFLLLEIDTTQEGRVKYDTVCPKTEGDGIKVLSEINLMR